MSVQVLYDSEHNMAALYCSTSDWAFGPVFLSDLYHDADERAEAFLRWLNTAPTWSDYEKASTLITSNRHDPRELTDAGCERAYSDWRAQEAAQWAAEESVAFGEP